MAEFKINGRMKVRTLKEMFKNEFKGTLRVYDGNKSTDTTADDEQTIASIKNSNGVKEGVLECRASRTVGKFIEEAWTKFGLKVKVASPDNWVLALDGITLSKLKDIPNNARKADMESLLSYKRDENTEKESKKDKKKVKKITVNLNFTDSDIKQTDYFLINNPKEFLYFYKNSDKYELSGSFIRHLIEDSEDWTDFGGRESLYTSTFNIESDVTCDITVEENNEVIFEEEEYELECTSISEEDIESIKTNSEEENIVNYVNNYNENQWFDPFGFNRANIFRKNTYTQKYSDTFYLACGKYCSYITVSFEFEIPEDETFDISKFKLYETNYEYCDGENENWINPMIAVYNDNLVLAGSCDDIDIYNEYDNYFLAFDNQTSLINLNDWTPARLNFSDPCTICDCKYEISKTSNEDEAKEIFEWYKKSNDKDTTIEFIRKNQDNINWNCISDNIRNYPIEFIREFKDMLDWDKVTMAIFKYDDSTESMTADLNFFKEFKIYIRPWFIINVPDIDKNILIELLKLFEGPFSRLCDERWTLFNETQTFNSEEDEYIQKLKSK